MKPYLLIAGDKYYPDRADGDWVGCYETREKAEEMMTYTSGAHSWQVAQHPRYGKNYSVDWYEIIDLRKWISESEGDI
jgi:hypothetical protein